MESFLNSKDIPFFQFLQHIQQEYYFSLVLDDMGLCDIAFPTAWLDIVGLFKIIATSLAISPYVLLDPYGIFERRSKTIFWNGDDPYNISGMKDGSFPEK